MNYKRKTISKVLGCLLALTLLLGLPPGAALADSTDTAADYVSTATLSFSDSGITETVAGSGYSVSGTTLSISAAGVYAVTGSCSEGNIVVKKATTGVVLILQDLTLSCSTTAATRDTLPRGRFTDSIPTCWIRRMSGSSFASSY